MEALVAFTWKNVRKEMSGRTSSHQKLVPTLPWIENCLMVTKSLKVGCLPYAVGKQPSIPLINRHGGVSPMPINGNVWKGISEEQPRPVSIAMILRHS